MGLNEPPGDNRPEVGGAGVGRGEGADLAEPLLLAPQAVSCTLPSLLAPHLGM